MSAPFRYARILNGLSLLISSRSAISRKIRAIARLSKPQTFRFDAVVEQAGPAACQRRGDRRMRLGRAVAEKTSAAARAAHLGGGRSRRRRADDQVVNGRRRDARRQPLAVFPFPGDLPADLLPVAALQRRAHRDGGVANPLEAVEDMAVAIDVAFA